MACTGLEYCKLAITETKSTAQHLVAELEDRLPTFDAAAHHQRQRVPQLLRAHPGRRHRPQGRAAARARTAATSRASRCTWAAGSARRPGSAAPCAACACRPTTCRRTSSGWSPGSTSRPRRRRVVRAVGRARPRGGAAMSARHGRLRHRRDPRARRRGRPRVRGRAPAARCSPGRRARSGRGWPSRRRWPTRSSRTSTAHGGARRRRAVPGHRLPLRADAAVPARGRGPARRHGRRRAARADRRRAGRPVRPGPVRPRPRRVLHRAQGVPAERCAGAVRRVGQRGAAGRVRVARDARRSSGGTPPAG